VYLSGIKGTEKNILTEKLLKLGIKIQSEWNASCTHLLVTELKVALRVVQALASAKHIIGPSWIDAIELQPSIDFSLPKEADYLPRLVGNLEVEASFAPDIARTTLFENIAFFVFSQDMVSHPVC
jgi:hypothetical protein